MPRRWLMPEGKAPHFLVGDGSDTDKFQDLVDARDGNAVGAGQGAKVISRRAVRVEGFGVE